MSDQSAVIFHVPGKINLSLEITGLRADGYHDLVTVFQTVGVYDKLTVRRAGRIQIAATGLDVPTDDSNLCVQAARGYFEAADQGGGCEIVLHKEIPIGGGLGGGSADAAWTLRALEELYGYGVDLESLAVRLGSDVPFFLQGGTALGEGRGEKLTPLKQPALGSIVVAQPGEQVSTARAYEMLSRDDFSDGQTTKDLFEALKDDPNVSAHLDLLSNTFQEPGQRQHPQIEALREQMIDEGALTALLCGSGSCVFGIFETIQSAHTTALGLRRVGYWSLATNLI